MNSNPKPQPSPHHITISASILTTPPDTPLLMAPIGVQGAYHPHGEEGVATACASLHVPYIYSTAATTPRGASAVLRAERSSQWPSRLR